MEELTKTILFLTYRNQFTTINLTYFVNKKIITSITVVVPFINIFTGWDMADRNIIEGSNFKTWNFYSNIVWSQVVTYELGKKTLKKKKQKKIH